MISPATSLNYEIPCQFVVDGSFALTSRGDWVIMAKESVGKVLLDKVKLLNLTIFFVNC